MRCTYFERAVLGLWDKYPDEKGLNGTPAREDDVQSPLNLLEGNWIRELVDKHSSGQRKVGESHALCAHFE
jgi:hypothetical protein